MHRDKNFKRLKEELHIEGADDIEIIDVDEYDDVEEIDDLDEFEVFDPEENS